MKDKAFGLVGPNQTRKISAPGAFLARQKVKELEMKYGQNKIAARNIVDSEAQQIINLKTRGHSVVIFSCMTKGFRAGDLEDLEDHYIVLSREKGTGSWGLGPCKSIDFDFVREQVEGALDDPDHYLAERAWLGGVCLGNSK